MLLDVASVAQRSSAWAWFALVPVWRVALGLLGWCAYARLCDTPMIARCGSSNTCVRVLRSILMQVVDSLSDCWIVSCACRSQRSCHAYTFAWPRDCVAMYCYALYSALSSTCTRVCRCERFCWSGKSASMSGRIVRCRPVVSRAQ